MAYAPKDLTREVDVQCGAETKGGERALDVVEGKLRAGGAGGLVGGVGPDSTRVARILCAQQIADQGPTQQQQPVGSKLLSGRIAPGS